MARRLTACPSLGSGASYESKAERWVGGFERLTWHCGHVPTQGMVDYIYTTDIVDVSTQPDPGLMIQPHPEFINGMTDLMARLVEWVSVKGDPWGSNFQTERTFVFRYAPVPIDEIDKYPLPGFSEFDNEHWQGVRERSRF